MPEFLNFPTGMVGIEVDKISLLWRLEMAGCSMESQWPNLVASIKSHIDDCYVPFVNAHFFYALARAGETTLTEQAIKAYSIFAEQQPGVYYRNWYSVGKPLMEGIVAFAQQDWHQAVTKIKPYIGIIGCVGGSDAQIDLFQQTYLYALIKAKQNSAAQQYLQYRSKGLSLTPLESYWAQV